MLPGISQLYATKKQLTERSKRLQMGEDFFIYTTNRELIYKVFKELRSLHTILSNNKQTNHNQ